MLKTLLKHDFLPTYKRLLHIFLALLAASIAVPLLLYLVYGPGNAISVVILTFGIVGLTGVYFVSFVYTLMAIQKVLFDSFYKPQGYLTFTLPFPLKKILLSKVIVSLVYLLAFFLVSIIGVTIIVLELPLMIDSFSYQDILNIFGLFRDINFMNVVNIILSILSVLGMYLFLVILVPFSGALAHSKLTKKNNERKAALLFVLFWFLSSFVLSLLTSSLLTSNGLSLLIITTIYYLTLGIGGFFLTAYIMDYKIDIE